MHRNFGNPGTGPFLRPELTVIAGSVSEPRREIEPAPAPFRDMGGLRMLLALCLLSAFTVIGLSVWGLS